MISQFFKFSDRNTSFGKECLAGAVTFATMAYVLVLNPSLLSAMGMNFGAALVATIIVTAFSSILMGFLTNYPVVIAPAMAVSGYLAFSIIGVRGRTWEEALGITALIGVILFLLNV